jgi:hypothetical protein
MRQLVNFAMSEVRRMGLRLYRWEFRREITKVLKLCDLRIYELGTQGVRLTDTYGAFWAARGRTASFLRGNTTTLMLVFVRDLLDASYVSRNARAGVS